MTVKGFESPYLLQLGGSWGIIDSQSGSIPEVVQKETKVSFRRLRADMLVPFRTYVNPLMELVDMADNSI